MTQQFEKDVRFYKTKKKYKKIDDDIETVVKELELGNLLGDEIKELELPADESTYKVRVANTSANIGKSGGFRLIYYVIKNDLEIFLLTIYSKKDKEDISSSDLTKIIIENCT
ncbi:hypothetical protein [Desulfitispora alkaliphila]|uniref:hypothetical protein n=1 Tax=Desulfitispora alkaliphila TaxID=622674 RepID=UPI003D193135